MSLTTKEKKEKLFTTEYLCMLITFLAMCLYGQALFGILPVYFRELKGFSETLSGALVSLFPYSAMLFRPFSIRIIAFTSSKTIILLCLVTMLLSLFILPLTTSYYIIVVVRVLTGFAICLAGIASSIVMARILHESRFNEGIGYYSISTVTMSFFGPALARIIVASYGYNAVFIVLAFVLSLVTAWWSLSKTASENREQTHIQQAPVQKPWYEPRAIPYAAVLGLLMLSHSSVGSFLLLFAAKYNFEDVSLFYLLAGFSMVFVRIITSLMSVKFNSDKMVKMVLALIAACLMLILFMKSMLLLISISVIYGVSFGIAQPLLVSFVLKSSSSERLVAASATYYVAIDAGLAFGSLFWGFVAQYISYKAVFPISAGIVILALFLFASIPKIKKPGMNE
ncbi:MAG: MFS transporter [Christensenellales bacterium]